MMSASGNLHEVGGARKSKPFKTEVDNALIESILSDADHKITNKKYVGNGHFLILRSEAGKIAEIIDRLALDLRDVKISSCDSVVPEKIEKEFKPKKQAYPVGCKSYVTDGKKPYNSNYYWLLVEKMGFSIHGAIADKPHAIVKNGKIIGAAMFMNVKCLQYPEAT